MIPQHKRGDRVEIRIGVNTVIGVVADIIGRKVKVDVERGDKVVTYVRNAALVEPAPAQEA